MARTPSNMAALGSEAPKFKLLNTVDGNYTTSEKVFGNKGTVVMFLCNHCPFVVHVNPMLVQLAKEFHGDDIRFVGISSNDVEAFPDDSPDKMKAQALRLGYPFPYLYDQTQAVAKAYNAACTPDFFVYDAQRKLIYRGQLDDSRPQNGIPLTGNDLRKAIDSIIKERPLQGLQKPSIGCNIKWKLN